MNLTELRHPEFVQNIAQAIQHLFLEYLHCNVNKVF